MLRLGPKRTILKRRIIPFFVETFCDGNHPDHNRPCAMRVLHEIDCPHHRVAVRFSREEFYLRDYHSSRGMDSFQGMLWVLMKKCLHLFGFRNVPDLTYD